MRTMFLHVVKLNWMPKWSRKYFTGTAMWTTAIKPGLYGVGSHFSCWTDTKSIRSVQWQYTGSPANRECQSLYQQQYQFLPDLHCFATSCDTWRTEPNCPEKVELEPEELQTFSCVIRANHPVNNYTCYCNIQPQRKSNFCNSLMPLIITCYTSPEGKQH